MTLKKNLFQEVNEDKQKTRIRMPGLPFVMNSSQKKKV